jgi:hypothetical protein
MLCHWHELFLRTLPWTGEVHGKIGERVLPLWARRRVQRSCRQLQLLHCDWAIRKRAHTTTGSPWTMAL